MQGFINRFDELGLNDLYEHLKGVEDDTHIDPDVQGIYAIIRRQLGHIRDQNREMSRILSQAHLSDSDRAKIQHLFDQIEPSVFQLCQIYVSVRYHQLFPEEDDMFKSVIVDELGNIVSYYVDLENMKITQGGDGNV